MDGRLVAEILQSLRRSLVSAIFILLGVYYIFLAGTEEDPILLPDFECDNVIVGVVLIIIGCSIPV